MNGTRFAVILALVLAVGTAGCGRNAPAGGPEGAVFHAALLKVSAQGEVCFLAYPASGGRGWVDPPQDVFITASVAGRPMRPASEAVLPDRDNPQLMNVMEKGTERIGCFFWLDVHDRTPAHLTATLHWTRGPLSSGAFEAEADLKGGEWQVNLRDQ